MATKTRRSKKAPPSPMTLKAKLRLIVALFAAAFAAIGVIFSLLLNDIFFSFYPGLSRSIMKPLAALSGLCPLSVWELALGLILVWAFISFLIAIGRRRKLQWFCGLICGLTIGLSLFILLWGLNHFGPTIDQKLELEKGEYSVQELTEATAFYLSEANRYASQVSRAADGTVQMSAFRDLASQAADGYRALGRETSLFHGSLQPVKPVLAWKPMSYFGTTGIFVCLTGESCVNPDTYPASLPFTMCHEMGHRMAFAAEDEANFCAYLACRANESPEFRYSGAYCAFIYCYNALYEVSPAAAQKLWEYADPGIVADAKAAGAHYAKYESSVQDAAQKVNDSYLKAFQEPAGVQSYGQVTDLLIALYLSEKSS